MVDVDTHAGLLTITFGVIDGDMRRDVK